MKKKHKEMMIHLSRFVDKCYFPDYELSKEDFYKHLSVESTGKGERPSPLEWAKKLEEITITQMWHEMADAWAMRAGWWAVWRDNLSHEWRKRNGSNIMTRKILAQARLIKKAGGFMNAMNRCSYFSQDDSKRYTEKWLTA